MKTISKETLAMLRKQYPTGTRVELVHMDDPYTSLTTGDKGTVRFVDDIGTVHISRDCGSSLGAVYGVDVITKII
ncbi:MAG: DUF4314 domain-containing protein [Clostridia bacterium]|nr:DUF4314 domain-containing protein [Clostridia bacterium]